MSAQDTLDVLKNRRSCRKFSDKKVSRETLEKIVEAGQWAPSGMGRQPVQFVVITDKEQVAQLSHFNAEIMGVDTDPFYGAGTVIVVLVDPTVPTATYDGALAMGNLLNAAQALGVDSCWIHRAKEEFDSPLGRSLLKDWGLPEGLEGIGHCILGYAEKGGRAPAKPRRDGAVVWA